MPAVAMRAQRLVPLLLLAAAAAAADKTVAPTALPTGGTVVAGQATIREAGARMDIDQTSQRAVLDWRSFDIGAQAHVNFNQPSSSSIALNRVLSNDPSAIYGRLTANGQVFFSNPSGVLFAPGAQVDVGGIAATTLDIGAADFMAGKNAFSGNGNGAAVVNKGTINAAAGGYVALFGPRVSNEGVVTARLGKVVLGAADAVTLDFVGNGLLEFKIDRAVVDALAENKGLIQAPGGEVLMTARTASQLLATVVNNEGVIEAQTIDDKSGRILLLGDMERGIARVGGTLDTSAPNGGDGGFIETSAAKVKIEPTFKVNAIAVRGKTGLWLIDPNDFYISAVHPWADISGAGITAALAGADVQILSSSGAHAGSGDIFVDDTVTLVAGRTLTLKAERDIAFTPLGVIAQGAAAANVVLWANAGAASTDGVVSIGALNSITTNGGHVWIGGGSGSTTWNGLTVGDGYAKAGRGNPAVLIDGTINAGAGDVMIRGQADSGSQAVSRNGTVTGNTVTVQERFVLSATTSSQVATAIPVFQAPSVAPPPPPANTPSVMPAMPTTLVLATDTTGANEPPVSSSSSSSTTSSSRSPSSAASSRPVQQSVRGAVTAGRVVDVGRHPMFVQPIAPGQTRVTLLPGSGGAGSGAVVILGQEATVVLDKPNAAAQTGGDDGEITHGQGDGNAVRRLTGDAMATMKDVQTMQRVRDAVTAGRVVDVGRHAMFTQPVAPGQTRVTLLPGARGSSGAVVVLGEEATVVLDKPNAAAQTGGSGGEIAQGSTDNAGVRRVAGTAVDALRRIGSRR